MACLQELLGEILLVVFDHLTPETARVARLSCRRVCTYATPRAFSHVTVVTRRGARFLHLIAAAPHLAGLVREVTCDFCLHDEDDHYQHLPLDLVRKLRVRPSDPDFHDDLPRYIVVMDPSDTRQLRLLSSFSRLVQIHVLVDRLAIYDDCLAPRRRITPPPAFAHRQIGHAGPGVLSFRPPFHSLRDLLGSTLAEALGWWTKPPWRTRPPCAGCGRDADGSHRNPWPEHFKEIRHHGWTERYCGKSQLTHCDYRSARTDLLIPAVPEPLPACECGGGNKGTSRSDGCDAPDLAMTPAETGDVSGTASG